mgnify:FL=1|jgi:hypothetical protein|tara:strand:- start:261 stop:422 length:162 start_codon:yes stop_codon:yes gene_type:complete
MKTERVSMFHTFNSEEELDKYVSKFNGSEGVIATAVMMMTKNTMRRIARNNND